ncbi:MAG: hypothetical protein HS132_13525 [Planctomycetia bacterium]|nr:hypothetical protein [Planctomycetia bacterium]
MGKKRRLLDEYRFPGFVPRAEIKGVRMGLFGLGELEDNKPICLYFKELPTLAFSGNEIMICETVCLEQRKKDVPPVQTIPLYSQQCADGTPEHIGEIKEKGTVSYPKTRDKDTAYVFSAKR